MPGNLMIKAWQTPNSGATNEGFLSNTFKPCFRLSRRVFFIYLQVNVKLCYKISIWSNTWVRKTTCMLSPKSVCKGGDHSRTSQILRAFFTISPKNVVFIALLKSKLTFFCTQTRTFIIQKQPCICSQIKSKQIYSKLFPNRIFDFPKASLMNIPK